MIAGKCLENVDMVFGLHVWNFQTVGTVGVCECNHSKFGSFRNCSDRRGTRIQPQATVDPIVAGAQIVTALQTVVSRSVDPFSPAVVSVNLSPGDAANVIAGSATMKGTVRTKDEQTKQIIIKRMKDICSVATATGASVDFEYQHYYPNNESTRSGALFVQALRVLSAKTFVCTNHLRVRLSSISKKPGAFLCGFVFSGENEKSCTIIVDF